MRSQITVSGTGAARGGVTVLVPAYNEAESIVETIESLQRQTLAPAEIIVIDDGSDDGTGDVAASLGRRRVRRRLRCRMCARVW